MAFAIAGTVDIDLTSEPIGVGADGSEIFLRDLWPTDDEVARAVRASLTPEQFTERYAEVFGGGELWNAIQVPKGETFSWDANSTYVIQPPFFEGLGVTPAPVRDVHGARVLAVLGDSVTTDHISPAGAIRPNVPAGEYLLDHGVKVEDFNTYGTRRGNSDVMARGTFANLRLRNRLAPGTEGGITTKLPEGEQTTIFAASEAYGAEGTPLLVITGKEYGSGSSRDWAAKGPMLLGVRAVLAQSYERIHRSNLIGMGIAALQFLPGETLETHGLEGTETYDVVGLEALNDGVLPSTVTVRATRDDASVVDFEVRLRIDTGTEADYFRSGGVLNFVLRNLAKRD